MTNLAPHTWGCSCVRHKTEAWDRSEHWTREEVDYLETWYGQRSDEAIGRALGRSALGVFLKAKRLGLHKRAAGLTARGVAELLGSDASTVCKVLIRRRFLKARRYGTRALDGRAVHWIVAERSLERFILDHPEWVEVDAMPDSLYRDLAARDPWIGLDEVLRLTGRNHHAVAGMIAAGTVRGRRRGTHWRIPLADIPLIRPLRSPDRIAEAAFRRASNLEMRRNRRKGVVGRSAA